MTLHGLRHSWATLALLDGIPTKVVSEILGHSSTRVTEDVYQHVTPGCRPTPRLGLRGCYTRPVRRSLEVFRGICERTQNAMRVIAGPVRVGGGTCRSAPRGTAQADGAARRVGRGLYKSDKAWGLVSFGDRRP